MWLEFQNQAHKFDVFVSVFCISKEIRPWRNHVSSYPFWYTISIAAREGHCFHLLTMTFHCVSVSGQPVCHSLFLRDCWNFLAQVLPSPHNKLYYFPSVSDSLSVLQAILDSLSWKKAVLPDNLLHLLRLQPTECAAVFRVSCSGRLFPLLPCSAVPGIFSLSGTSLEWLYMDGMQTSPLYCFLYFLPHL